MQLGAWLQSEGHVSEAGLTHALAQQQRWGGKLGDILLSTRAITPLAWLAALNAQSMPTARLSDSPPDTALLREEDLPHYIAHQFLPHHEASNTLVIASPNPSETLAAWCTAHYGRPCTFLLITAREHHQFLQHHFHSHLTHEAREHLLAQHPGLSAHIPVWRRQQRGTLAILLALAASFALAPYTTWYSIVTMVSIFYVVTLAFKALLIFSIPPRIRRHKQWLKAAETLDERELPIYSILIPLYREPLEVIRQNLAAIDALDYPKTKLDVWLITEADDTATHDALKHAAPPDYCRILHVPASAPRTKPKACNVALPLLRGEFATIYDAEDIPATNQLKLAVAAFRNSRPKVACLQASLNYYNREENLLTRLFAIEYSALFTMFLPALRILSIPIPLGGTSNHLRMSVLREVGGWDPYNVTEDADLGIRLNYMGYRTDMLPSLTLEESPISLKAWLNQRSRWIKGYIQTWLVYMRDPLGLFAALGPVGFFGFQLFVGAPALTFLLAPIFWCISILLLFELTPALYLPDWLLGCCAVTFTLGLILQWVTAFIALDREGWKHMRLALWAYPFYWLLHSVACVKALWQLAKRPHFWEKTAHGKSRRFAQALAN